jgi:hypothetical protein
LYPSSDISGISYPGEDGWTVFIENTERTVEIP